MLNAFCRRLRPSRWDPATTSITLEVAGGVRPVNQIVADDLIFQVVSRRCEKKSLAPTINLAFAEWHTIFPNATCATAPVERVVHHANIVKIEGESYRLRESQREATSRSNSRRDKKAKPEN